jgi:hypothetical protein
MTLRRWEEFRKWQLGSRRKTVEFSEYLDEQRRRVERMEGPAKWIYQPKFDYAVGGRMNTAPANSSPATATTRKLYSPSTLAGQLMSECGSRLGAYDEE